MPKLIAHSKGLKEVTINEGRKVLKRGKTGTFDVSDTAASAMVKSGEFSVLGVSLGTIATKGYDCPTCGRTNVFIDSCGRCGWKAQ